MNILVFGLGALGTVFAVSLKADGHTVYGITKEKYIERLKNKILKIKGLFGQKEVQLDGIFTSAQEAKNLKIDLVIVSVKAYDTETVISQIKTFLNDVTVLLAQNGYGNYEIATSLLGRERVVLSRIIFGVKLIDTGFAEVTVFGGEVIIGQPDRAIPDEKLEEIAEVFSNAGIPTKVSQNVYAVLWDKIIYNSALNPLGAILECTYGELAENEETRSIMNKIIEEIFNVSKIREIKLNWQTPEDYIRYFYEKLIPPTRSHFPSMYYDIKQGKKTEIDALNGAVVRLAKEAGISASVNETITNLIKAKEKIRSD